MDTAVRFVNTLSSLVTTESGGIDPTSELSGPTTSGIEGRGVEVTSGYSHQIDWNSIICSRVRRGSWDKFGGMCFWLVCNPFFLREIPLYSLYSYTFRSCDLPELHECG